MDELIFESCVPAEWDVCEVERESDGSLLITLVRGTVEADYASFYFTKEQVHQLCNWLQPPVQET